MAAPRRKRCRRVLLWAHLSGALISWLRVEVPELGLTKATAAGAAPGDSAKPEKKAEGRRHDESTEARPGREGDASGRGGDEIPQKIDDKKFLLPWRPEPDLVAWGLLHWRPEADDNIMDRDGFAKILAKHPDTNLCDPWENHLIFRWQRRGWKYNVKLSPAVRLFFLRAGEDMAARCPPAHEKAKTVRQLRTWYTFGVFYGVLLRADFFLHGKAVLTPKEVARYAFAQPKQDGGHLSDNLSGDFLEETKQITVEKIGVAEARVEAWWENTKKHNRPLILRGHRASVGTHFEEWDDDPARDGDLGKLRANDPEVDRQLRHYEEAAQKYSGHRLRTAETIPSNDADGDGGSASGAAPVLSRAHLYWFFFWNTEAEIVYMLEQYEAMDEMLPSDLLPPVEEAETWTRATPASAPTTTARRLPAKVSDHPVDWRPKARATVEIPYAAYPVVPTAARQRHWLTGLSSPVVTGRDAETGKPIVQFLRLVNTRASGKTELVKLLLHSLRVVLSKQDFEKFVNPEDRPYLKWFLTVKHPRGAPDEYLQELRDLDDWRKGFVWACGSVAVLLLLLGLAGGVWVVRLFWKSEAIRQRILARRESREVASASRVLIGYTEGDGAGDALAPLTADAETATPTFGRRAWTRSGDVLAPSMAEPEASIFGRRAPPNTSVSSITDHSDTHTEAGASTSSALVSGRGSAWARFPLPIAPPNTSVSSFRSGVSSEDGTRSGSSNFRAAHT